MLCCALRQRKTRVTEWVTKTLPLAKPGVWGCVQARTQHRKCEDYRGTHFYNKDSALVIKRWINRVEDQLQRVACLWFQAQGSVSFEVFPPALEADARIHARSGTVKS
jgi:hypothetical protein